MVGGGIGNENKQEIQTVGVPCMGHVRFSSRPSEITSSCTTHMRRWV